MAATAIRNKKSCFIITKSGKQMYNVHWIVTGTLFSIQHSCFDYLIHMAIGGTHCFANSYGFSYFCSSWSLAIYSFLSFSCRSFLFFFSVAYFHCLELYIWATRLSSFFFYARDFRLLFICWCFAHILFSEKSYT